MQIQLEDFDTELALWVWQMLKQVVVLVRGYLPLLDSVSTCLQYWMQEFHEDTGK